MPQEALGVVGNDPIDSSLYQVRKHPIIVGCPGKHFDAATLQHPDELSRNRSHVQPCETRADLKNLLHYAPASARRVQNPSIPAEEPPAEQPPAEEPPAEEPPAEQPPADQGTPKPGHDNGQSGESSGQKRTIGMLMNDLVTLSSDADAVKAQAVSAKKAKKTNAADIEADYQLLSYDREADSKLLTKVVINDLTKNDGRSGIYYTAFLRNLKSYTKADRSEISDVISAVKANIRHEAAQGGRTNAYKARLQEMKKF